MEEVTPGGPAPGWLRDITAALAAACCAAVLTFPRLEHTPAGPEGAWRLELVRLASEHLFGSQAVFTYGPLGPLLAPTDSVGALAGAAVLRWAHQVALAFLVGHLVLRRRYATAGIVL